MRFYGRNLFDISIRVNMQIIGRLAQSMVSKEKSGEMRQTIMALIDDVSATFLR